MTEEGFIYRELDNVPRLVEDWSNQLRNDYTDFNRKYFGNQLPEPSEGFVCAFQDLPGDIAGVYIRPERAGEWSAGGVSVRPGIRINSRLKGFTPHVRIALLHEMIHASGIEGHDGQFKERVAVLVDSGAYAGLL